MAEKTISAKEKRELLTKGFTAEEIKQLEIQLDPVKWCHTYLQNPEVPSKPFSLRDHQAEIIASKAKKKVLRIGRRGGKSIILCAEALYNAYTQSNFRILICTPYKVQTASLWKDGFLKLIKDNPLIETSISRVGQNPFTVEFKNGSRILGLTAGSSTGNKGGSIRGQSSDLLILDECDYMGESAIQSIVAIIGTNKKTRLIISSTPTGKREFFYQACTRKELGFTEFYYPSSASPEWLSIEDAKKRGIPIHESQEYTFRNMYPEAIYMQEFEAVFGSELMGVFKHKYIDSSLVRYNPDLEEADVKGNRWYCGDQQKPGNLYAMGVDWNGLKNGTQIVITEYMKDPTEFQVLDENDELRTITEQKKYRLFYRESVSMENMTQVESIRRVVELNQKFKIDHIYVDFGYGHTNIEELKLYGNKNPESQINRKLVSINFGGKVSVYDPFSKEELEKAMKPFCINNIATCLERGELILPESEDEKVRLCGQMREYRVESISPTGNPRYSEDNDHILDAFGLSLLAFQMEYSELIKLKFISDIAVSKKPSMLLPGLDIINDRTNSLKKDKLEEMGIGKRAPAFNTGKYHSDSRGGHMDFEDLVKNAPSTQSPFRGAPVRTGWSKVNAPTRSSF